MDGACWTELQSNHSQQSPALQCDQNITRYKSLTKISNMADMVHSWDILREHECAEATGVKNSISETLLRGGETITLLWKICTEYVCINKGFMKILNPVNN